MFKTILFLFLAYLLWRIIRFVMRVFQSDDQGYNRVHGTTGKPPKGKHRPEITDADFEELDPDGKKDN